MAVAALRDDADVRVRAALQQAPGHGDVAHGACHNERGLLPGVAGVDDGPGPIGQLLVDTPPTRVLRALAVIRTAGAEPRRVVQRRATRVRGAQNAHGLFPRPRPLVVNDHEGPSHVLGLDRQVELRLERRAVADGGHGCLFSYL